LEVWEGVVTTDIVLGEVDDRLLRLEDIVETAYMHSVELLTGLQEGLSGT
jgi:hypothetical protein